VSEALVVAKDHMITLLNELLEADRFPVGVSYPPYGVDLLEIRRDFQVRLPPREALEATLEKARTGDPAVDRELLSWRDLKDCLQSSGALPPGNLEELGRELEDLHRATSDALRSPRLTLLGLDTNMAYLRFFSRHFPALARRHRLASGVFRYAVAEAVVGEIDRRIRWKYRREVLQVLRKALRRPDLLEEFKGRNTLSTRKGKLAQGELDFLRQALHAFPVPGGPLPGDKEEVDGVIAEAYGRFQKEHSVDLVVLTSDQNMVDHLVNAGVRPLNVNVAFDVPSSLRVHHWTVPPLLHDLAVTFGVIQIGPFPVFGEWRGKTRDDYAHERLMVRLEGSPGITQQLARDVQISDLLLKAASGTP
jgi:hypothetical protein